MSDAAKRYRTAIETAIAKWEGMKDFDDPVNVIEKVLETLKLSISTEGVSQ